MRPRCCLFRIAVLTHRCVLPQIVPPAHLNRWIFIWSLKGTLKRRVGGGVCVARGFICLIHSFSLFTQSWWDWACIPDLCGEALPRRLFMEPVQTLDGFCGSGVLFYIFRPPLYIVCNSLACVFFALEGYVVFPRISNYRTRDRENDVLNWRAFVWPWCNPHCCLCADP